MTRLLAAAAGIGCVLAVDHLGRTASDLRPVLALALVALTGAALLTHVKETSR